MYGKIGQKIQKQIDITLKHLVSLLLAIKIRLSKNKRELNIFRKPRQKLNINLCIKPNGRKLTPSPSIKYLGDETFSGKDQCKALIDKLLKSKCHSQ